MNKNLSPFLILLASLHKSFSQKQYNLCLLLAVLISWHPFLTLIPSDCKDDISFCETHFLIVGVTFKYYIIIFSFLHKKKYSFKFSLTLSLIDFYLCSSFHFFESFQTFSVTSFMFMFSKIKIFYTLFRIVIIAPPAS
jgi:hypothetical protein